MAQPPVTSSRKYPHLQGATVGAGVGTLVGGVVKQAQEPGGEKRSAPHGAQELSMIEPSPGAKVFSGQFVQTLDSKSR